MTTLTITPYVGWDLVRVLQELLRYQFMQHAYLAGTIVAIVAGVIGYFVVLRGLSFAAHALSHIGFAGASGAVVLSLPPLVGLLAFTIGAGTVMGALGRRIRGRDVTIGIVLAWALGLGALFLRLYTGGYATQAFAILFGEIFGISSGDLLVTAIAAGAALLAIGVLYRPLLFTSLDDDVAEAKGVPVRPIAIAFMIVLAVTVSEAVQVVGVLLIFSLIVTPAAIAERLAHRPSRGLVLSAALALFFTWAGLTVAYYLPYPPSFFITSFAFWTYVLARTVSYALGRRRAGSLEGPAAQLRQAP